MKDHLGNTRVLIGQDGQISQQTDYYAFGMQMNRGSNTVPSPDHKYKYNGKELQDELNMNLYDYGARFYDPVIARWNGMDLMAEKYLSYSPYHYAANNPITNYDIDGNEFSSDAWRYVNDLITDINSRQEKNSKQISAKQAQLANGGLTDKQIKKLNGEIGDLQQNNEQLEQVRGETATLAAQDQVYNVKESDQFNSTEHEKAATLYNTSSGAVDIVLPSGSGLGLFSHELKHAFQFHMGTTSIGTYDGNSTNNMRSFFAYDQQDEKEAYKRLGLFGSTFSYLPSEYSNRPQGPINVLDIETVINLNNLPYKARHAELQKLAQRLKIAFTVSNETYAPSK